MAVELLCVVAFHARQVVQPEKWKAKEEERWWRAVFLPLSSPRKLLPKALADQDGLVGDPDPVELDRPQGPSKLTPEECEELLRLCSTFARMVAPPLLPEAAPRVL